MNSTSTIQVTIWGDGDNIIACFDAPSVPNIGDRIWLEICEWGESSRHKWYTVTDRVWGLLITESEDGTTRYKYRIDLNVEENT